MVIGRGVNKHQLSNGPVPQYYCQLASWEAHSDTTDGAAQESSHTFIVLVGPAGRFLVIHS
jgi:hypothetical protein